jgi:hypothetical protein
LLGMAELCEYFARRVEMISGDQSHPLEHRQSAVVLVSAGA